MNTKKRVTIGRSLYAAALLLLATATNGARAETITGVYYPPTGATAGCTGPYLSGKSDDGLGFLQSQQTCLKRAPLPNLDDETVLIVSGFYEHGTFEVYSAQKIECTGSCGDYCETPANPLRKCIITAENGACRRSCMMIGW